MGRKLSIDTLRGLACLLLVAFHVIGHDASAGLRLPQEHLLAQSNDVLALLRMPLFSFLSGFVYAWRPYEGNAHGFVRGKVRRLLVPLLLVGTLFAVIQAYTPGTNAGPIDWRLLHIVPVAHYWFLESLFIIFLVTALLEHFALISTPGRFAAVWLWAALLFIVNPMPIYFGLQGAVFLLPFFLLGLASNRFAERLARSQVLGASGALLVMASLPFALAGVMPERPGLAALIISASACVFLVRSQFELRWLAWIGAYSFAIYLFHSMFSAASRIALMQMGVTSLTALFTVGMLAGVAGPIVAAIVLRRIPWGYVPLGESKPRRQRSVPVPVTRYADPTVPKQN
jgi:surface polysaccharide O-acyltransferase-like enzyme